MKKLKNVYTTSSGVPVRSLRPSVFETIAAKFVEDIDSPWLMCCPELRIIGPSERDLFIDLTKPDALGSSSLWYDADENGDPSRDWRKNNESRVLGLLLCAEIVRDEQRKARRRKGGKL